MTQTSIFWPMIAHVALIAIVYTVLAVRRYAAVRLGEAKPAAFKTRVGEPERSITAANNIANQFEVPVLFHLVCLAVFVTAGVTAFMLALAWLFIASRYLHAYIHLTTNRLKYRTYSFRAGLVVLGLMWLVFAVRLAGLA